MSHDSLTGFKPVNPLWNLFKRWWKCQDKTLAEQYANGVEVFDIRVCRYHNQWWGCHGLVRFNIHWFSLPALCNWLDLCYPKVFYRIVLERGSNTDVQHFLRESLHIRQLKYPKLWRVDIKSSDCQYMGEVYNHNSLLFQKGYLWASHKTWDLPFCKEIHGSINKSNWYKINLKKEAIKIWENEISKEKDLLGHKEVLYTLDFI